MTWGLAKRAEQTRGYEAHDAPGGKMRQTGTHLCGWLGQLGSFGGLGLDGPLK